MVQVREAKPGSLQSSRTPSQWKGGAEMQSATSGPQINYVREEMSRSAGGKVGAEQPKTNAGQAPGSEPVAIPHDVLLEQIAHHYAYQDAVGPEDVRWLESQGYQAPEVHGGVAGFSMSAFRPLEGSGQPPVLAFRGTNVEERADRVDDMHPSGPGTYQFQANEGEILEVMASLGGAVEVTGHSLGGALAQFAAAKYPGLVRHVETYQSPGISADDVANLKKWNADAAKNGKTAVTSTHHRVDQDAVDAFGPTFTPGDVHNYDAGDANSLSAHATMPVTRAWAHGDTAKEAAVPKLGDNASVTEGATTSAGPNGIGPDTLRELGTFTRASVANQKFGIFWEHYKWQYLNGTPLDEVKANINARTLLLSAEDRELMIRNLDRIHNADQILRQQQAGKVATAESSGTGATTSASAALGPAGGQGGALRTRANPADQDRAQRPSTDAQSDGHSSGSIKPEALAQGFTRAEFVTTLDPSATAGMTPSEVMSWAKSRGLVTQERPGDPITRAEGAQILATFAGVLDANLDGRACYFSDVDESAWFFRAAHACRLHGIFVGDESNHFLPQGQLDPATAKIVVDRALCASKVLTIEEQKTAAHLKVAPLTEPSRVAALLEKETLTAEEIERVRGLVAQLPEGERPDYYRQLAEKVTYRNQRNNESRKGTPADYMCNTTSMAMVFTQLGVSNADEKRQFENVLYDKGVELTKNERGPLAEKGQNAIAGAYGVKGERVAYKGGRTADGASKWFGENVRPRLERGEGATMSIATEYGHIVRLEWVTDDGVKVDDPWGRAKTEKGGKARISGGYDANDGKTESGKGEDNHWPWDFVARNVNYVHFFSK